MGPRERPAKNRIRSALPFISDTLSIPFTQMPVAQSKGERKAIAGWNSDNNQSLSRIYELPPCPTLQKGKDVYRVWMVYQQVWGSIRDKHRPHPSLQQLTFHGGMMNTNAGERGKIGQRSPSPLKLCSQGRPSKATYESFSLI